MKPDHFQFFRRLIDAPAPSGFEEAARAVWREVVAPHADELGTDVNGSEIATLRGAAGGPSVLLMGHIDQIGLLVRYIDDDGFLYVSPIGGVDPDTMISQVVRLVGPRGIVRGVVGKLAIHLQDQDARDKKLKIHDLWIDIGARNRQEAEQVAPVGTPAVIGEGVVELLNGRVAARMDNRFGAYVVARVLERLALRKGELVATVHGAATAQEESSRWFSGAAAVAYRLKPTLAIAVDVNHATDIPGAEKRRFGDKRMGAGPIVSVGVSSNNRLTDSLREAAAAAGIRIQIGIETGYHGTDADAMGWCRAGIATASVGIPMRYMHNTVEMAELADIEAVVDLLEAFVLRLRPGAEFTP
jgi:endoglucanase